MTWLISQSSQWQPEIKGRVLINFNIIMLCNDLYRFWREDLLFGFEMARGEELFGVWVVKPSLEDFVLDTGCFCQP